MKICRVVYLCLLYCVCALADAYGADEGKGAGAKADGGAKEESAQKTLPAGFFDTMAVEVKISKSQALPPSNVGVENLQKFEQGALRGNFVVVKKASDASPEKIGLLCEVTFDQFKFSKIRRSDANFIYYMSKAACRASYKFSYSDGSKWNKLGTGSREFLLCRDYYNQLMTMLLDELVDIRGISSEMNPGGQGTKTVRGAVILKKKSPFVFSGLSLCSETNPPVDDDGLYQVRIGIAGIAEPGKSIKFSQSVDKSVSFGGRSIAFDWGTLSPFEVTGLQLAPVVVKEEGTPEKDGKSAPASADSAKSSTDGKK